MVDIVFYEKPGCINNTRQKIRLQKSGHTVIAKNLLTENWAGKVEQLRDFFGDKPVSEWFNRSAPAIKNGEIDPGAITAEQALALMISEPLLIRRPLLEVGTEKTVGFDEPYLEHWIGLNKMPNETDIETVETCPSIRKTSCNNG